MFTYALHECVKKKAENAKNGMFSTFLAVLLVVIPR